MSNAENSRAVMGSNAGDAPDFAKEESDRLRHDYAEIFRVSNELLEEYDTIPEVLASQQDKERCASLIKRMRDAAKRLTGFHELEKMPHYRRGQAVDQTFFGEIDKLAKRDRKANDGAADTLNNRLTDYDVKELARETARRRQAALDARKEADWVLAGAEHAQREADAARKRQEEAEAGAARARKPETVAARQMEVAQAKVQVDKAQNVAFERIAESAVAERQADQAYVDTMARPADVMRQRLGDGTLSGMGTEKFAEIISKADLDLEALRPHLTMEMLEKAVRGYANSHSYSNDASVQIKGARFGKRAKSRVG